LADALIIGSAPQALTSMKERFDPKTSIAFKFGLTGLAALIVATGFVYSFVGLYDLVAKFGITFLAIAGPLLVDGATIFSAGLAIRRTARGQSTTLQWWLVAVYTGISVIANSVHPFVVMSGDIVEIWDRDWPRIVAGSLIGAVVSFTYFLVLHMAATLWVPEPEGTLEERRTKLVEAEAAELVAATQLIEAEAETRRRVAAAADEARKREEAALRAAERTAAWGKLKDDPQTRKAGTPEREQFVNHVLHTFEGEGRQNLARTARVLDISTSRVDQVISQYELADTSR
jgi:hypothetical protein